MTAETSNALTVLRDGHRALSSPVLPAPLVQAEQPADIRSVGSGQRVSPAPPSPAAWGYWSAATASSIGRTFTHLRFSFFFSFLFFWLRLSVLRELTASTFVYSINNCNLNCSLAPLCSPLFLLVAFTSNLFLPFHKYRLTFL